jgi:hypothetical protein
VQSRETRFSEHNGRPTRRVGGTSGRRFVFLLALALAAIACSGASAEADQTVVRALVYNGSRSATVLQQVELSALENCAPYSGSNPIDIYVGGTSGPPPQAYPLPTTTWPLATVLTCGLRIPLSPATSVQVSKEYPYQGLEAPLSYAQLTQTNQFQDPQAPSALPVISTDGSDDQNSYTRPWLGGSDDNAADQVTEVGAPVTIAVYENAPPLVVHVSWTRVSETARVMKVKLSGTAHTASGAALPASSLTWSWSFASGPGSTAATPTHSFPAGVSPVTVQVTDANAGAAGTATVEVTANTSPVAGTHSHSGGSEKNRSTATVGSSGSTTNTNTTTTTTTATTATTTSESSTTAQTTTTGTQTMPRPPRSTSIAVKPIPRKRVTRHLRQPPATVRGPVVQGLLISNVTPVAPTQVDRANTRSSPPPVRQATRASSLAIVLSGLVILALLALGAGYELRGSRNRRALRAGN